MVNEIILESLGERITKAKPEDIMVLSIIECRVLKEFIKKDMYLHLPDNIEDRVMKKVDEIYNRCAKLIGDTWYNNTNYQIDINCKAITYKDFFTEFKSIMKEALYVKIELDDDTEEIQDLNDAIQILESVYMK